MIGYRASARRRPSFRDRWLPPFSETDTIKGYIGKWAATALILGGTIWGGIQYAGNSITVSEGTRTGRITKFSEKGIVLKTYEGQLLMGGLGKENEAPVANTWDFSIDNLDPAHSKIVENIEHYQRSQQPVNIDYRQVLLRWPWRSRNTYLVQKVEPLETQH